MTWGANLYGDPCRQCGYDWSIAPDDAVALMATFPDRYAALIGEGDGSQRHPDLAWSARAYVCHVTDNLHIWAERIVGCVRDGASHVTVYDPDLLSQARAYNHVAVAGALWSLRHAVEQWREAVTMGRQHGIVLLHSERGAQTVLDIVRTNTHDAYHHEWDIRRSIAYAKAASQL